MSPEPEFWTDTNTRLRKDIEAWDNSRISSNRKFACKLTSANGIEVYGVLTTADYATGALEIPIVSNHPDEQPVHNLKNKFANMNKSNLKIEGHTTGSEVYERMDLSFAGRYTSTFATVDASSIGDGRPEYSLSLSTHLTDRAKKVSIATGATHTQTALAVARDIEASLPKGFKLTPIRV